MRPRMNIRDSVLQVAGDGIHTEMYTPSQKILGSEEFTVHAAYCSFDFLLHSLNRTTECSRMVCTLVHVAIWGKVGIPT
jgi:hypothetical protein